MNHKAKICNNKQYSYHGVFMEIFDLGVLITGPSNIGKSTLALQLIEKQHKFIADDSPLFALGKQGLVYGSQSHSSKYLLEIRNFGIINVIEVFGDDAVLKSKQLDLIIKLSSDTKKNLSKNNNLDEIEFKPFLKQQIPHIIVAINPFDNIAKLVENTVKSFIERQEKVSRMEFEF